MHLDLLTVSIQPLRQAYDKVAARIGGDKMNDWYTFTDPHQFYYGTCKPAASVCKPRLLGIVGKYKNEDSDLTGEGENNNGKNGVPDQSCIAKFTL